MLSYRTAYLKANYPVEFMAAVLGCELGNADKVAHFIGETVAMEIPVLGPDVNQSRESFAPVHDNATSAIRFGLGAIKGVGNGPAEAILIARSAEGPFRNFNDFAQRVDAKSANRKCIENLIKSGAFDSLGDDRGVLLENLDAILNEVSSLRRDAERGQTQLFDLFEDPAEIAEPEPLKGKEMPLSTKLMHERELLGFYLSGHPVAPYASFTNVIDSFTGEDWMKMEDRAPFRVCGVITHVTRKISRRDNRPWCVFHVATTSDTYTLHAFSNCYGDHQQFIGEGNLVLVEGQVVHRKDDEIQLLANSLQPLASGIDQLVKDITFVVGKNGHSAAFVELLRTELEKKMGKTVVRLGIRIDSEQVVVADLAASLSWELNTEQFNQLKVHPAVEDVRFSIPEPQAAEPKWGGKGR
jgi:DNA polymerase-3 subunit alpha